MRSCFVTQELALLESKPRSEHAGTNRDEAAAESLRLLGEAYRGKDQLMDALNLFDAAVARAPKTALMFISRGRCNLDLELKRMRPLDAPDKPTKKELVSHLQSSSVGSSPCCSLRHDCNSVDLWQAQKYGPYGAAALKDFNKAVSLDRTSALFWNELGIAKRRLHQEGRGFEEFTMAISCDLRCVDAFVNRAPLHVALGNSQLALYDYTRAIDIDHTNLAAYVNRGVLQYSLDCFAMAIADMDQAIKLEPRCSVAWYNRGVCYQKLKQWDQAVQDYTKALGSSPANFRVLRNRALTHLHGTKRPDLARSDFLRALQEKPDSVELLCGLGLCEHQLKRPEESIDYYTQALQHDPNCVSALLGRGNVYLQATSRHTMSSTIANAKRLCMADYQRAIHLHPNFVPAHVNMALALHASKRDIDAWHSFTAALALDPANPTALEGRAASNQVLDNRFGAYIDMSAAISMEPENARLLTTHGFIAQIMNDVHIATLSFMKAAKTDPSYSLAHYNLATMLRTRGDLHGAKEAYTRAIDGGQSKPGRGHFALLNRGVVHMELGNLPAALADFSAVIKAEPTSVAGYVNRARAHASCSKWQEAEADYNKAVALTPLDKDLYKERSDVCAAQHKAPECLMNYATFLVLADGLVPEGTNENSTAELAAPSRFTGKAAVQQHPVPSRLHRRRGQ